MGKFECECECYDQDSWVAPGPRQSSDPRSSSGVSGDDSGGIPTSNERSSDPRSSSGVSGGRPPASGSSRGRVGGRGRSRGRGHVRGRGSVRGRGHFLSRGRVPVPRKSPSSVLAVLLFAAVLFFAGNLDGSEGPAWAMSPVSENVKLVDLPLVMDLSFDLDELWASLRSGGTAASSRVSCQSGYSLTSDGLACEKRESRSASVSCPAGSSQYSLGMGGAWGCRRDLGAASATYSCAQGVLVTVTNGFQGGKACKVTSSSTASKNASAKCNPRGTPPSCRYSATVLTRQSQSASSSCSPSGSPPTCSYTAPVLVRQSQSASSSCSPSGSPPTCRYTALVSTRESKSASRYCSPSGTPPSCRYLVKQSSSATYHYIPGIGGYYYCSSGWTLSGSSCYRYVTSYGSLRYSCSSGWTLSGGTCYRYSSSRVTRYGTLSYSCSSGWTLSGSTCYRYSSSTVTRYGTLSYSCSSDWTLSGSSCYRYVSSTVTRYGTLSYECSSGWTLSGSKCTRTTTSVRYVSPSSSLSCSSGTLSGGKCWSYPAKVKSCPNGWTLSSGSCTLTLTASPIYTYSCPQGRTLRGTRCYVTPTTTTTTTTSTTTTTTAATTTTATIASSTTSTSSSATSTTAVVASTTTTTVASSPQVSTTTTSSTVPCSTGWVLANALCATHPGRVTHWEVFEVSGGLRVFWEGTNVSGRSYPSGSAYSPGNVSDLSLRYEVQWREVSTTTTSTTTMSTAGSTTSTSTTTTWNTAPVATTTTTTTTTAASGGTTTTTTVGGRTTTTVVPGGFYGYDINGLRDRTAYEVKVVAMNGAFNAESDVRTRTPVTRDPGGWQPYNLPRSETAYLNDKIRRGEALRICTTVRDFVKPITAAVEHWNTTLDPLGVASPFQDVFSFSNAVSTPAECGERARGGGAEIIPPASGSGGFDIIVSDYRCPEGSTDANNNACPLNTRLCVSPSSCVLAPITRCTDANRVVRCAASTTKCGSDAAGCTWPNFSTWSGKTQGWAPRPVDGSAIQIVVEQDGLFEHELGHLLGLDDYGDECAWEKWVSSPGSGLPRSREYKVPSLYSYKDGPRSWQVLVDDPSKYNRDYFTCGSDTVTIRDKEDLSSIYYPEAFLESSYDYFSIWTEKIWRFKIATPPIDPNPSESADTDAWRVCGPGEASTYVYNAYAWIIMHRAKGSSGAWKPLRKDTAGTTRLTDGELVVFRQSDFFRNNTVRTEFGRLTRPTELLELHVPDVLRYSVRSLDCKFLVVNVDLSEPAYASIRSHEFVVMGLTRGDPLVNADNLDGTSRSNILLDLGDGAKQWTLGEPSAVITFPGSS